MSNQETKYTPQWFWTEFKKVHDENPLAKSIAENTPTTKWFEERMRDLAKGQNPPLHCQNKLKNRQEWLNIDHVFVTADSYALFPLVAVEHENGSFCRDTKQGKLPNPDDKDTYIEWAFWKSLSMRCKLSVLVAYPKKHKEENANALKILSEMLKGWAGTYGESPSCLVIFGMMGEGISEPEDKKFPYIAYYYKKGEGLVPIEEKQTNA